MSAKKSKKSKIIVPLIVICLIILACAAGYVLLAMPMGNMPSWISSIRESFFASSFWLDFENNFITDKRYLYIVKGLGVTFQVTFFAVLLGIVLGVIVALVRSSYDTLKDELRGGFGKAVLYFFYKICGIYLTVIRGTPVVVQLMIIYFVIFASSNNKILVATLAFGINSGAYVAEIIRGGIMSVDKGQFEAGRSLGFGYVRTMAFIIIPQAFKTVLPSLANEFIVLIKETSVSGYVGLQELTKGGDIIRSRTYSAFMPLIAVAIIYLVIVMFFSWLVSLLERRLKNSER
jgi:polar amino acid transport system permease protein/polar amino acid transport system substrate-binding protein